MGRRSDLIGGVGLREAPADVGIFSRVNSGDAKGIVGGGAVVEEKDVGAGVFVVPGVDAFVFAVVDPPAVENHRHAREQRGFAEFVAQAGAGAIHGNAREGPVVGPGGGAVDAVPTINV